MIRLPARAAALLTANPMINKELRSRMRGARSAIVLTIYLGLLAIFCLLFYWLLDSTASLRGPADQQIGRDLLYAIVIFETLLVVFLAPAFTVGAISGERERQTLDLLLTTLLRPWAIVLGKMGAALAFLLVLILAVAPLESLAFMFGGVAPEEIGGSLVVLVFAALLYGSIGLCASSLVRSTVASTVITYGVLLLLLIGVPFIWFISTLALGVGPGATNVSQSEIFFYISGLLLSTNPLIAMAFSDGFLHDGRALFVFTDSSLLNGRQVLVVQPWLLYCLFALVASALLLWLSSRVLPPVRRRAPIPGPAARAAPPAPPADAPPAPGDTPALAPPGGP